MHVENVGVIFLYKKVLVSQWMKHIDLLQNFICDHVEDGTVKIKIFRSEENISDPFTNNLSNRPLQQLTPR